MFRSFSFDHPQGAICHALCRYYNVFRWFASLSIYMVCGCMCILSVCVCVCLLLLSVEGLFVNCFCVYKHVFNILVFLNVKVSVF
jgi:hypothetical protein